MPQESRDGRDRLAEYVHPTVYTPPVPSPPRRRTGPAATVVRLIRAVLGAAVFLGGTPALLLFLGGNPVRRLPSWTQFVAWFDQPSGRFTPNALTGAAIWALWLLWAVLALLLVAELLALVTRWRIPVLRLPAPLHRLVFGLAGTAAIAVTSVGNLNVADGGGRSPAAVASTDDAGVIPRQAAARGPVLIQVAGTRYLYTVERNDTLSKIAKEWLGDAGRWPEICRLNKHRHFPRAGGALRDCDLIYPGWDLRLPADARPPQIATPTAPSRPPAPPPAAVTPSPPPSTPKDASSPTPSSTTNEHDAATVPDSPAPATHGVRVPSPSAEPATPTVTASPSTSPTVNGTRSSAGATDEHGVQLSPANWLPWSLAAAISAAAALVWAQRRRRYTGEPDTDPPTQLPPPVLHLRRAVARNTELPNPDSQNTEPPTLVPDLTPLPSGTTGVVGDGAHAAARAALVAALASGDPHHPDARGEVVIDVATLATLLGPDTANLQPWPRLHIADSIADALTVIEATLLHRSRILDEHALTDLDTLRQHAPDEETLPPLMLIAHTPPAGARTRAEAVLAFGRALRVSALLLGEWAHGATVEVTADGHTNMVSGQPDAPLPARLPVLESEAAIQILTTLREAQTGEPPAVASPALPVTVVPLHASRATKPSDRPTPVITLPADAIAGKVRLRVLGQPRIEDITRPGRPLRAKALELAVFLACHPDGMTTRDIGEYLEPDARISQADQRVHTNASNLRHVLARAGTADAKSAYLIKTAGRYRLDPATVDVDVWTLRDLLRAATVASGPRRRELLTAACDLSTAPLADGQDYEWLQPHRETARRWGTEAHLLLADDLIDTDPQGASALLDKAIGLDRYNEALYTRAMHTRHALGDADGIRTLLRALTRALTDIDAEPQETTIALANQLRNSLAEA
ncbi:LysM peptidoglycan-binding domain-containing protein [Micromonospora sp. DR5-3]|uniref:LysM peptidoglycan-binding domain-containing protein n=1 Tax=unclassified Micromonospora TaxID=2617518 RepID=UPI0011D4D7F2|nr:MULTISPECIES: LysM peptidoglycan-binding domain-containing protein [unclassified Micromonospora]MCW3818975.1 LysM peptidoglycan-binding domain-containing protein [Micromonospora sp. DR5-3]TYC14258.1 LysM peptidoglycan-binding domain-containing protein [Micromonospora sp. MP36]